jgi:hypothetical protein
MKQLIKAQNLLNPSQVPVQDDELYIPMSNTKFGTTILCQPQVSFFRFFSPSLFIYIFYFLFLLPYFLNHFM